MSTQLKPQPGNPDWKDRYYLALAELEEKEKAWTDEEGELYKSILRLVISYTGLDEELDRQLSEMRDSLRKENSSSARSAIISPVINSIVEYARQRDDQKQDSAIEPLQYLLRGLKLPDSYRPRLDSISDSLGRSVEEGALHEDIDRLTQLIAEASSGGNTEPEGIQLKSDDPLTQLLENLSLPGELGIEILGLRKRAGEIEEEQERLQVIQDLVQVLTRQHRDDSAGTGELSDFPQLQETLLELFEWLSIPEEYQTRVEHVKSRIGSLHSDPDLSAVLRDTAIVINDLQEALQMELGDIQDFLGRVTTRLEEVEDCFREMAGSESETREETRQLNSDIQGNVRSIRLGIAGDDDIRAMKQSIESRLSFIEQSVEGFLASTQRRQQTWEDRVSVLKERIDDMKGETVKLHRRIHEEHRRAKTDALTGIANRLAYNEKIKQEFARWQRNAQPFSICVVDVDKFKGVNDSYGHKAGDKVLKTIAQVCAANIRKMDFIARYGGEEFVLLLPETGLEQARLVAENLRSEIEKRRFHYAKDPVPITVSCGLAEFGSKDTTESVFARADRNLYRAKENGRNQVV